MELDLIENTAYNLLIRECANVRSTEVITASRLSTLDSQNKSTHIEPVTPNKNASFLIDELRHEIQSYKPHHLFKQKFELIQKHLC